MLRMKHQLLKFHLTTNDAYNYYFIYDDVIALFYASIYQQLTLIVSVI